MIPRPPRYTRTATPFPYTTPFRSSAAAGEVDSAQGHPGCAVKDAAIHDVALMLHRAAALTGTRPEELLEGLSDAALTSLYLGCAQNLRSEEHTSELQSLMRISYAVFCLKTKNRHEPVQPTIN